MGQIRAILEPSWPILGQIRAILEPSWAVLEPFGGHLGAFVGRLGALSAHLSFEVRIWPILKRNFGPKLEDVPRETLIFEGVRPDNTWVYGAIR